MVHDFMRQHPLGHTLLPAVLLDGSNRALPLITHESCLELGSLVNRQAEVVQILQDLSGAPWFPVKCLSFGNISLCLLCLLETFFLA